MKEDKRWLRSFRLAYEGILYALVTQRHMKIHFMAAFAVLIPAYFFRLSKPDTLWILLSVTLVISAELLNTAVERTVDLAMPRRHPAAKAAKDAAAGAVLAAAVFAALVGAAVLYEPAARWVSGVPAQTETASGRVWIAVAAAALAVTALHSRLSGAHYKKEVPMVDAQRLLQLAAQARSQAYAPYSQFKVGSAVLDSDGTVHLGCNVENSAYGPTNCAERTALFRAIADGVKPGNFAALAVVGDTSEPISPCGVCRQVMAELCPPDMPVIMGNLSGQYRESTVSQLLPGAFGKESLRGRTDAKASEEARDE